MIFYFNNTSKKNEGEFPLIFYSYNQYHFIEPQLLHQSELQLHGVIEYLLVVQEHYTIVHPTRNHL